MNALQSGMQWVVMLWRITCGSAATGIRFGGHVGRTPRRDEAIWEYGTFVL